MASASPARAQTTEERVAAMIAKAEAEARKRVAEQSPLRLATTTPREADVRNLSKWVSGRLPSSDPPLNRSTSPVRQRSPSVPMPSPSPVEVQAENLARRQLEEARQALMVERGIADAKREEARLAADRISKEKEKEFMSFTNELMEAKQVMSRLAAEKNAVEVLAKAEKENLERRLALAEQEVEHQRDQLRAAEHHIQQRGAEVKRLLQQLEESSTEREKDMRRAASAECETMRWREQLTEHSKDAEMLSAQLASTRSELVEALANADEMTRRCSSAEAATSRLREQLAMREGDVERLLGELRSVKMDAVQRGHQEDAAERRVADAELETARKTELLAAAEQQLHDAESEVQRLRVQLTQAMTRGDASERRASKLEEDLIHLREGLLSNDAASERQRQALEAGAAQLRARVVDLEMRAEKAELELERYKAEATATEVGVDRFRREMQGKADEEARRAVQAEREVQRMREQMQLQAHTAAQRHATVEASLLAERDRVHSALEELDAAQAKCTHLELALQQALIDVDTYKASGERLSSGAALESRRLKDQLTSLEQTAAAHRASLEARLKEAVERAAHAEDALLKAQQDGLQIEQEKQQLKGLMEQSLLELQREAEDNARRAVAAEERLKGLQGRVEALEKDLEKERETTAQLRKELSEKASTVDVELETTRKALAHAEMQTETTRQQLEELQRAYDESVKEASELRERLASLEGSLGEGQALGKRVTELEGELSRAREAMQRKDADVSALRAALEKVGGEHDETKRRLADRERELEALHGSMEGSAGECARLRAQLARMEEMQGELDRLRGVEASQRSLASRVDELQHELQTWQTKAGIAQQELLGVTERLTQQAEELDRKAHELESLKEALREASAAAQAAEQEAARCRQAEGEAYARGRDMEAALADMQRAMIDIRAKLKQEFDEQVGLLRSHIANLIHEMESNADDVNFMFVSRSELVRSIWDLLTELGVAKQVFEITLGGAACKKALVKAKPVSEELHKVLEYVTRARQQAKWIVANFFSEVEKMHLGTSEWHFTPSRSRGRSPSVGRATASKRTHSCRQAREWRDRASRLYRIKALADAMLKPAAPNVGPGVSPPRSGSPRGPSQTPVPKPNMGPYTPDQQRVSINSDAEEAIAEVWSLCATQPSLPPGRCLNHARVPSANSQYSDLSDTTSTPYH
eukprot:Sspe_Gene.33716::Locus_16439_Transcript_1_1_Confidence_1.000_Length_3875::g.33716::m.33716